MKNRNTRFTRILLSTALSLIILGIATSTIQSERNLDFMATMIQDITVEIRSENVLYLQLISLFIVLSSIAILVERVRARDRRKTPPEIKQLLIALFGYYFFNVLFNTLIGKGSIQLNNIYPVLVFMAVGASTSTEIDLAMRTVKKALLAFFLLGFTYIFFEGGVVLQQEYEGWIPGLDVRFYGLAAHANSAGPLAITMLLLEMSAPSKGKKLQGLIVFVGGITLLMSQSKTAWIAALISIAIIYWYSLDISKKVSMSKVVIPTWLISLTLLLAASLFFDVNPLLILSSGLDEQTMTLTGRSQIWEVAIDEWVHNPFFGYGGALWDENFRRSIDMMFAFHAHNQILQVLSTAGLAGLLSFSFYVLLLLSKMIRLAKETKGVTGSFCTLLAVGSIAEIPFLMTNVLTAEVLIHLIAFSLIVRTIWINHDTKYYHTPSRQ